LANTARLAIAFSIALFAFPKNSTIFCPKIDCLLPIYLISIKKNAWAIKLSKVEFKAIALSGSYIWIFI
jgi:hypothetical protein